MNDVIYARYSCDRQTENSILGQVRECTDFARKEGIDIINVYKDEAISGRTAIKRPGFMQMIHDANKKIFDYVIVDPEKGPIVKEAFDLYTHGETVAGVVTEEHFQNVMEEFFTYGMCVEMYYNDDAMKRWFVDTFINAIYLTDQEILINFKYRNRINDDFLCLNYSVYFNNTIVHLSLY